MPKVRLCELRDQIQAAGRTVRVISGEKAKLVLQWEAETPFPEGLRRYVDWYTRKTSRAAPADAPHAAPAP